MRSTHAIESRRPGGRRRQRGFSFIEILIGMAVSLIGLAGLMSVYITTVQANARSTRTIMASTLAQQTMEELRAMPVVGPTGYDGPTLQTQFGIPSSNVQLADTTGPDGTVYRRFVSVAFIDPAATGLNDLALITVSVAWMDEGADFTSTDARLRHDVMLQTIRTRQDLL